MSLPRRECHARAFRSRPKHGKTTGLSERTAELPADRQMRSDVPPFLVRQLHARPVAVRASAPARGGAGADAQGGRPRRSGQNAKTVFPLKVADMVHALEKVCFQEMRLPCQTPSAVTVTGA